MRGRSFNVEIGGTRYTIATVFSEEGWAAA